ncbi:alkaline phosphatase family protein [Nocardia sp. NPDC060256]|uniref:alkaline phosphatase family protein n=1 Tax=unclassified Nocardia TaxID=2637762 RepID=UPI00365C5942
MRFRHLGKLAVATMMVALTAGCGNGGDDTRSGKHVLLVSIDGMHEADLAAYVAAHTDSTLAKLASGGLRYTNATTPTPSDSFPGLLAQVTGGTPKTTGVYYDASWDRTLLPAGTTNCAGAKPGADVELTEVLDRDSHKIDGGSGLSGLPDGIGTLTGDPTSVLDPAKLPVDPTTCKPISPGDYLKVNTIFGVAHKAGLRTAWSDKHPAYTILNGPGGNTIDDLFTPEIDSAADGTADGATWTKDNDLTQRYDKYKVDAIVNEIDGKDHSGAKDVGVPAVFGMNFQSVSTAQKLPKSGGKAGGYAADGITPGPVLGSALAFVDAQLGRIVTELDAKGLTGSTTIIVSAKHGQGPMKPETLTRIDADKIIEDIDKEWGATHSGNAELIAHGANDDGITLWLSDRSPEASGFVKDRLLARNGDGTDIAGNPKPFHASGIDKIYAGADAAAYFGTGPGDARVPDIYAVEQPGTVYTGGKSKIAEHGGGTPEDRHVPLIIAGAGTAHAEIADEVATTRIAPTVLTRLGLNPQDLQAVAAEHTQTLPKS